MARFRVQFETDNLQALPAAIAYLQSIGFDPRVFDAKAEQEHVARAVQKMIRQPVTGTRQPVTARQPVTSPGDRDAAWEKLLSLLKDNPKAVLRLVKDSPNGISTEAIALQLNKKTNWFTGVLNGGIQRNVRAAGFELDDVVVIDRSKSTILYFPGRELKRREVP